METLIRLLEGADEIDIIVESQPGPSPEILSAGNSPTRDIVRGTEGMVPRKGSGGNCVGENAFARAGDSHIMREFLLE